MTDQATDRCTVLLIPEFDAWAAELEAAGRLCGDTDRTVARPYVATADARSVQWAALLNYDLYTTNFGAISDRVWASNAYTTHNGTTCNH